MGYPPLGCHRNLMGSLTFCKGCPLQNMRIPLKFNEILRVPLRISSKFNGFLTFCKVYPLQNVRISLKFNETLRGTP